MRTGWLRPAGWSLATAAIIGLSGYGVHTVLSGPGAAAAAAPAPAPVLPAARATAPVPTPSAPASALATPSAAPSASPTPPRAPAPTTPAPVTAPVRSAPPTPSAPDGGTGRRTYTVTGGTVVLDVGADSAALVSQTPRPGWSVRVVQGDGFLRVDFTSGNRGSAVLCSWHGHPPQVQTFG
jgi:cytoskeletal protein RodZ